MVVVVVVVAEEATVEGEAAAAEEENIIRINMVEVVVVVDVDGVAMDLPTNHRRPAMRLRLRRRG